MTMKDAAIVITATCCFFWSGAVKADDCGEGYWKGVGPKDCLVIPRTFSADDTSKAIDLFKSLTEARKNLKLFASLSPDTSIFLHYYPTNPKDAAAAKEDCDYITDGQCVKLIDLGNASTSRDFVMSLLKMRVTESLLQLRAIGINTELPQN